MCQVRRQIAADVLTNTNSWVWQRGLKVVFDVEQTRTVQRLAGNHPFFAGYSALASVSFTYDEIHYIPIPVTGHIPRIAARFPDRAVCDFARVILLVLRQVSWYNISSVFPLFTIEIGGAL